MAHHQCVAQQPAQRSYLQILTFHLPEPFGQHHIELPARVQTEVVLTSCHPLEVNQHLGKEYLMSSVSCSHNNKSIRYFLKEKVKNNVNYPNLVKLIKTHMKRPKRKNFIALTKSIRNFTCNLQRIFPISVSKSELRYKSLESH